MLGRHRQNWEPIEDRALRRARRRDGFRSPCNDRQRPSRSGRRQEPLKYEDRDHPLPAGRSACAVAARGPLSQSCGHRRAVKTDAASPYAGATSTTQVSGMWRPVHRGDRQRRQFALETDSTIRRRAESAHRRSRRRGRGRRREPGAEPLGHGLRRRQAVRGLRLGPSRRARRSSCVALESARRREGPRARPRSRRPAPTGSGSNSRSRPTRPSQPAAWRSS